MLSEKAIKILRTVWGAVSDMMYKLLSPPCKGQSLLGGKATKGITQPCELCNDRTVYRDQGAVGKELLTPSWGRVGTGGYREGDPEHSLEGYKQCP